jgi:predicted nuclease of predicted toxin-antitoxin system
VSVPGLSAIVYLDHNVDPQRALDLRASGFDAVFPQEIGLGEATDEAHLRYAAATGRIVVTHDLKDFPRLAREWYERGETHAGIVLCGQPPQVPYGELLRRLLALLNNRIAEEFVNEVVWLTRTP